MEYFLDNGNVPNVFEIQMKQKLKIKYIRKIGIILLK